ncbi:hypothetical protein [Streptomyces sp. NRRL F-2747]|uniref:hypothetical protein n=1 Tax=Streptomyces sp. NRRL F-2747 TaxID=1463843 RepID=UPI00131DC766|nr:hypothetical protein [Streptomyces sp. NRRL F-2747]
MSNAKLIPVGFYADTEFGEGGQPLLVDSIDNPIERKGEVLRYLKSAFVMMTAGVGVYDEVSESRELIGACQLQTDGVWVWPNSYPFYVERYNAHVPVGLVELACSRGWSPPSFSDDEDFDHRMPFG